MSSLEQLEDQLIGDNPALPCEEYSPLEKAALWLAMLTFGAVFVGFFVANDVIWTDGLKPVVWDPIVEDAGSAGDADYNPMNTLLYTFSMLASVVAGISHYVASQWENDHNDKSENKMRRSLIPILSLGLFFHWSFLYQPAYSDHESMGMLWVWLGVFASYAVLFSVLINTRGWPAMTRGLLSFGSAASTLGLFHWFQFLSTPWAQESSRVSESIEWWPLFVVLGIPGLVCYAMYRMGRDDALQMKLTGYEAGVLPDGIRIKSWESAGDEIDNHPVEMLSRRALLASPMVLAMVYGQLCDGFATMVGIDFFGYGEKHVVSNQVIVYGGEINNMLGINFGEGAWLFVLIKAGLIAAITMMFIEMKVETRQRHIRILIVLAVLIVGLAPGLRDIGRLNAGRLMPNHSIHWL